MSHKNHKEFACMPCKKGCQTCEDESPCIVETDPVIRWTVLGFTVFCILMVIGISIFVWRCRELQVWNPLPCLSSGDTHCMHIREGKSDIFGTEYSSRGLRSCVYFSTFHLQVVEAVFINDPSLSRQKKSLFSLCNCFKLPLKVLPLVDWIAFV